MLSVRDNSLTQMYVTSRTHDTSCVCQSPKTMLVQNNLLLYKLKNQDLQKMDDEQKDIYGKTNENLGHNIRHFKATTFLCFIFDDQQQQHIFAAIKFTTILQQDYSGHSSDLFQPSVSRQACDGH